MNVCPLCLDCYETQEELDSHCMHAHLSMLSELEGVVKEIRDIHQKENRHTRVLFLKDKLYSMQKCTSEYLDACRMLTDTVEVHIFLCGGGVHVPEYVSYELATTPESLEVLINDSDMLIIDYGGLSSSQEEYNKVISLIAKNIAQHKERLYLFQGYNTYTDVASLLREDLLNKKYNNMIYDIWDFTYAADFIINRIKKVGTIDAAT